MKNLLHPDIICTDPENLQFCLQISDTLFWYCEPNEYNDALFIDTTDEAILLKKYKGELVQFLKDIQTNEALKALACNSRLWLHGEIDVEEFTDAEKQQLLDGYGYTWDSFTYDAERNMIIAENYFEQNTMDFRHDI